MSTNAISGGSLTAQVNLNGTLQTSYSLTLNSGDASVVADFSSNPLTIGAGTRWNWQCTSNTATAQETCTVTTFLLVTLP